MVWQPDAWKRLHKLPARFKPNDAGDDSEPTSQIDVFTANIRWSDIAVPPGIDVTDQRLEAHGFAAADGIVIEGRTTDLATRQPVAATMRLELIEPQKRGYLYTIAGESKADAEGRWVLKNVPAGWYRVVVAATFRAALAGHERFDGQPQWKSFDTGLASSTVVAGWVIDESGKPLADVDVRLDDVKPQAGGFTNRRTNTSSRPPPKEVSSIEQVPAGKAKISIHKPGYCRPGPRPAITTPKEDIELRMVRSGSIHVTVEFAGKRPQE